MLHMSAVHENNAFPFLFDIPYVSMLFHAQRVCSFCALQPGEEPAAEAATYDTAKALVLELVVKKASTDRADKVSYYGPYRAALRCLAAVAPRVPALLLQDLQQVLEGLLELKDHASNSIKEAAGEALNAVFTQVGIARHGGIWGGGGGDAIACALEGELLLNCCWTANRDAGLHPWGQ